jgi:titin
LDGTLAGPSHGLSVGGVGNEIVGLVVNRFQINGISLESGSAATRIEGCFVGTDPTGTIARGNGNAGIMIGQSSDNVVGSALAAGRNVISGNVEGVTIVAVTATYNRVIGNYIGTDPSGMTAVPNGTGVLLLAPLNRVGGDDPGEGNLISGNTEFGISMGAPNATRNTVLGNLIGTDHTGSAPLGNDVGVWIDNVADNVVGGETSTARNVISGNREGVTLWGAGATMNHVIGNHVGTDASGTSAIPNDAGVVVYGPNNTVGGSASGTGNLISGNRLQGIVVNGALATHNLVQGNRVGTEVAGQVPLPNGEVGIFVVDAAETLVGGPEEGAGNLVSGNGGPGVMVLGAASTQTVIQGNVIGLTTGLVQYAALPNEAEGIYIDGASGTRVGGTGAFEGNVISGNRGWGVRIFGETATDNVLEGNLIGLHPGGSREITNAGGVAIAEAPGNFVGSAREGGRNVISGHYDTGVSIWGEAATGNVIQGNYIGTNTAGDAALGNGTGVAVFGAQTLIGGPGPGEGNLISGSEPGFQPGSPAGIGIHVVQGSRGTTIEGNFVGTDATGTVAVPNQVGIWLDGAVDVRVGGTAAGDGNVISGNVLHGMRIGGGSTGSLVQGNRIGVGETGVPLGNGGWGIHIFGGAMGNLVGGTATGAGNTIAYNVADGVFIRGDAVANELRGNAIHDNGQLGIDIQPDGANENDPGDVDGGPNGSLNHPVVMGVATNEGVLAKALMFDGLRNEPYTFEFFGNDQCDASGHGEGRVPLGTVSMTSAADGDASIALPVAATTHLTATVTDRFGSTSEFGPCVTLSNFTIDVTPAQQTIQAGGTASYQVTVSAAGAPFSDAVELGCSGGPAGSMCTFAEPELIPGETSATTTMTIVTPSTLRATFEGRWEWGFVLAASLILALTRRGARRRIPVLVVCLAAAAAVGTSGCGDDGTGPREPNPVTYQLQVSGEWEGITHGETATLVVN